MSPCTARRPVFTHAERVCGGSSARLYEGRPVRTSSREPSRRIDHRHSRFFGIVQAGYRELLHRITQMTEPTSIDVQGSDSDGLIERPRTPRTFSRVSSFNKSFSAELGESSENGSPYLNQFTTVGKGYGKSLIPPTSPTKIRAPRPLSTPSPTLDLKKLNTEEHPTMQAPSSSTKSEPQTRTQALIASIGADESSRGSTAGGVESTGIGDNNAGIALLSVNASPDRGLRSSKRARAREDRGGRSQTHEQPGSDDTPNKRKRF
jgi:hypothetical protein